MLARHSQLVGDLSKPAVAQARGSGSTRRSTRRGASLVGRCAHHQAPTTSRRAALGALGAATVGDVCVNVCIELATARTHALLQARTHAQTPTRMYKH